MPAFAAMMEIYTEANAPSERKSRERLAAMIQEPAYFFLVATESDRVVGFSIVRAFEGSDAALLEYTAVADDRRSQGIGSQLLSKTASVDALASKYLLAEVNSSKEPCPKQAAQIRRKAFYRRLGWRQIDQLHYIMPPVSELQPPAMDMLVYKRELPSSIERDRLRQWLQNCYVEVYGQSADDPRIEAMVGALPLDVPLV